MTITSFILIIKDWKVFCIVIVPLLFLTRMLQRLSKKFVKRNTQLRKAVGEYSETVSDSYQNILLSKIFLSNDKFVERLNQKARKNATFIVISNKQSELLKTDKILWMEEGAIKKIGKPNDIVSQLDFVI